MASIWEKFKAGCVRFFQGRNGADMLVMVCMIAAVVLNLLNAFFGSMLLSLLSMVLMFLSLFRMFSRNVVKRQEENRRFLEGWDRFRTEWKQALLRLKMSKEYKYFRCPKCRVRMRLKRGSGTRTFTCPKCNHTFDQKA